MGENSKIAAVVVTFNRLDMLKDTIKALQVQTIAPQIIVVNNGSTDGTTEYLKKLGNELIVINQENTGGAGGFFTGMKYACENNYDFVWVMDDDVIPATNALEILVKDYKFLSEKENVGYLCSRVISTTGENANVPVIDYSSNSTGYTDWGKYLEYGIIRVESATFVSVFIPTDVIKTVGLPIKEFFIWGDDTEYTKRIVTSSYKAFLSGKSEIIHRRVGGALFIKNFTDRKRIIMYKNFVRNNFYNERKFGSLRRKISYIKQNLTTAVKMLFSGNPLKAKVILCGLYQGLTFNPTIEFPAISKEKEYLTK